MATPACGAWALLGMQVGSAARTGYACCLWKELGEHKLAHPYTQMGVMCLLPMTRMICMQSLLALCMHGRTWQQESPLIERTSARMLEQLTAGPRQEEYVVQNRSR